MPVHDWTRVDSGIFHDFHNAWTIELRNALNGGLLPSDFYALTEQHECRRTLAIRHVRGHRLVALVEIVSPANKDRVAHVEELADKIENALRLGLHVLLLDLFPPGSSEPRGLHGVLWQRFDDGGPRPDAYVEHLAVGTALTPMPLFLSIERYINVPLETTYQAAYRGVPAFYRDILEREATS